MLNWVLAIAILSVNSLFCSFGDVVPKEMRKHWETSCSDALQSVQSDEKVLFVVSDELAFYTKEWFLLPDNKIEFDKSYRKEVSYYDCLKQHINTDFIELLFRMVFQNGNGLVHCCLEKHVSQEVWDNYARLMHERCLGFQTFSFLNQVELVRYNRIIIFSRGVDDASRLMHRLREYQSKVQSIHFEDNKPVYNEQDVRAQNEFSCNGTQFVSSRELHPFERTPSWVSFFPVTDQDWDGGSRSTDEPMKEIQQVYPRDDKNIKLQDALEASWDGSEFFQLLM